MAGPRFALDEDVSHPLAGLLRSLGYDADSAKELGRLGLGDGLVLLAATDQRQTLITHNSKDFRLLHEAWFAWRRRWEGEAARAIGSPVALSGHAGILIVPQVSNAELAAILAPLADSGQAFADRLLSWTARDQWHVPGR